MTEPRVYALDKETGEYVPPRSVNPLHKKKFICSECGEDVIFRNCTQKMKHFAHLPSSTSKCSGESDQHKFGKEQIKRWLDQNYTIIIVSKHGKKDAVFKTDNQDVVIEKSGKGYRADVAICENDKPKLIIEVTHTNKTTNDRPCKWYSINTEYIENPIEINHKIKTVELKGDLSHEFHKPAPGKQETKRVSKCKYLKIKGLGYRCSSPCLKCGKTFYFPEFDPHQRCYVNMCNTEYGGCKPLPPELKFIDGKLTNVSSKEVKIEKCHVWWGESCKLCNPGRHKNPGRMNKIFTNIVESTVNKWFDRRPNETITKNYVSGKFVTGSEMTITLLPKNEVCEL